MSDWTTESVADTGRGDPSMEDILASIRRIIADDAVEQPSTPSAEVSAIDLRELAAIPDSDRDQNAVLLKPEPVKSSAPSADFDDILIMEDEIFSLDDLEIPESEMFLDGADDIDLEDASAAEDDSESSMDAEILEMIESANFDTEDSDNEPLELLNAEPKQDSAERDVFGDIMDAMADADEPSPSALLEPVETASPEPSGLVEDENLLEIFGADIDLILDMDDFSVENEAEDVSSGAENIDSAMAAVEAAPQQIDTNPDANIAHEPEIELDDRDIGDLIGSLMADDEDHAVTAEDEMITISSPEVETDGSADLQLDVAADELVVGEDIMGNDDDLDLVKSLMADLTDDALLEDSMNPTNSAEAELMDDILELTMVDEAGFHDEGSRIDSSIPALEPEEDVVAAYPAGDDEDEDVIKVDASINALLQIAASAESDASELEGHAALASAVDESLNETDMVAEESFGDDLDFLLGADNEAETFLTGNAHAELASMGAQDTEASVHDFNDDQDVQSAMLDIEAELHAPLTFEEGEVETLSETPSRHDMEPQSMLDDIKVAGPSETETMSVESALTVKESAIFDEPDFNLSLENLNEAASSEALSLTETDTAQLNPTHEPKPEQETPEMPKIVARDGILDEVTEAATSDAFASLNQVVEEKAVFVESGPRIGDLVQEALRPMLKEWLDANLKGIVERAVAKEVKRISSGK